jgi:hypothetical protein
MIEFVRTIHVHISMTAYLIAASVLSLLFGSIGVWSLWRVRRMLAVMPQIQDRLAVVSNSVSLLADTTEACFKAVAMQLQAVQSEPAAKPSRAAVSRAVRATSAISESARHRRVVSAAKRGESVRDIAAREQVAESEVALRLRVPREPEQAPVPDASRATPQYASPWSAPSSGAGRSA